jgi:glycolate oxidase
VDDCAATVSEITARGMTPAALEMLDGTLLRMVEEATHAGYPLDAAGVLLIEMEGLREMVEEQVEKVRQACLACRAREFRLARTEEERALLWKGRKNAFGAIGRVSPFFYTQDGVVPRTQIAPTLREIGAVSRRRELTIGNIFHAGDGNMHPVILFDARRAGDLERAQKAGFDILDYCISVGGSITGEHGIGMEKMELIGHQYSAESLDLMRRIKQMFDPLSLLNPGKMLPTGRGCAEIRQPPLVNPSQMI